MMHILNQIGRWLMQPMVWRFIGFASAVVGLLCYALSSSFNYLFGNWNLLKMFLYSVFSFIICFVILFAKRFQLSRSLRFKTHTAFLVLTITSVYSFFFDKVMNGKQDAYSLISCAAFAIMSLNLSRQTQCGFEIDLLYFFLGCLTVQLMKIKLQLFIIGAGFSYSLIILRSFFSSIDASVDEQYSQLQDGNSVVLCIDSLQLTNTDIAIATVSSSNSMDSPQLGITTDSSSVMEQLETFVKALRQENLNFIQMLLDHVKKYCDEQSQFVATDPNFMMDARKQETIKGLEETAKVMVSAGFEKDFSDVYNNCRMECLQECLMHRLFKLKKLSSEDIHIMPWKDLEDEIKRWIRAFTVTLKILFPGERQLCNRVFSGFSSAAGFSFIEICRGSTVELLNFADSIVIGCRSPECLFKIIEVFETLRDLIPEFESLFCDQDSVSLKNEAITIWKKFGIAIRGIFMEFEYLIDQDMTTQTGTYLSSGLHPITQHVVNYLCVVSHSRKTLEQVFDDSSLSGKILNIMDMLGSNLEAKAKCYKDPSLGYIFLMNNNTYIAQMTKDNNLGILLGDEWFQTHTLKISHYQEQYQKSLGTMRPTLRGIILKENLSENVAVTDTDPSACAALDHGLKNLDRRISHFVSSDHPIWADSADADAFLDAVDDLIASVTEWNQLAGDKSIATCLVRAEDMLQHVMFRLEDEFRSLMERCGKSFDLTQIYRNNDSAGNLSNLLFDSEEEDEEIENGGEEEDLIQVAMPVTDYDIVLDALPSATINDLHEIAKRMVAGGFGKECSHVYSSCRREFLEESLSRLGLQKLSNKDVHKMPWNHIEDLIERWIKASNVALKILFTSERQLCDHVFFGFSSASDFSFMEVCRGSTVQLLNFADAVAIGSRSPERLFKILDVFETLRDLIPEFEALFCDQYSVSLRNEALTIWKRLGEAIRGIFMELENLIRRDPAKAAVPGGALHPITRYVMNYLRAACQSRQTLEQVFEDYGHPLKEYPKINDRVSSSLSVQMDWIMELLESNLEAKSKIHKDHALCYVFLMNNCKYIVLKAEDSELGTLLGDNWIKKQTAKIRQYHVQYQRSSWNKVFGLLKVEYNGSIPPNGVAKSMKEKLKSFNTVFDDLCRVQSSWFIFDEQLKEEIRISIEKLLLPAYEIFIGWFQNIADVGKHADRYIKYETDEIEAKLNDLFQGSSGSTGSRKQS